MMLKKMQIPNQDTEDGGQCNKEIILVRNQVFLLKPVNSHFLQNMRFFNYKRRF